MGLCFGGEREERRGRKDGEEGGRFWEGGGENILSKRERFEIKGSLTLSADCHLFILTFGRSNSVFKQVCLSVSDSSSIVRETDSYCDLLRLFELRLDS